MANPLLNFGNTLTNITQSGLDRAQNIFMNQAPNRLLDYTTNVGITGIPFAKDINMSFEGRTKPVTDISEIAPTKSTQNVLAEGIANAAYRVDNTKTDWTKPFSTIVKGSGQPNIRSDVPTYDYSGYKLGNPEEGWKGKGKESLELLKTLYGGSAENIIANTLGDYTATYTPGVPQLGIEDVMNLYDRYDFVGKMGEGRVSAYDIDIDLPPELLAQIKGHYAKSPKLKFKQQQLMNKKKQNFQDIVRREEAAAAAETKAKADAAAKAKAISSFDPSGPTQKSIRRRREDKSGRGHIGGFTDPGKGSYGPHKADGGLINFYRYGGFSG